jgi:hypothetical protein
VLATAFIQESGSARDDVDPETPPSAGPAGKGLLTWGRALGGGVLAGAAPGVGGSPRDADPAAEQDPTENGARRIQVVIAPSGDDITGLVHLGVISAVRLSEHVDVEVGVRAGAGELKSVACAGCGFSGYYGVTLAMFAGYRRMRFGTRFVKGGIEGASLLMWSPLVVRVQF